MGPSVALSALVLSLLLSTGGAAYQAEFHCPTDWHINNDLCYYVTDTKVTWHQADDLCKQMNATLVTIKSEAEDSYVENLVTTNVWIGLNDFNENNHFTWVDNKEANFTKWGPGEPNNARENCVSLYAYYNKGSWNDVNCAKHLRFVCQGNMNSSGVCAVGWHVMGRRCIWYSGGSATWPDARSSCQALGGDLVVIRNQTEMDFVIGTMPSSDLWIGLSDRRTEGVFSWLDQDIKTEYTNWHSGEPNNGNNGLEDCVNMIPLSWRKGQWATDGCDESYWYACETPATMENDNVTCADGWSQHNITCYKVVENLVTWSQARGACRDMASRLVEVESEDVQTFLNTLIKSTKVWIGLSDLRERDTWSWGNRSQQVSGYTNWAAKEPSTSSPRPDCVFLHTAKARRGRWEAGVCEMTLSYLCEAPAAGFCAEGWTMYNGHCYRVNISEVTWSEAETLCANMTSQGRLVSIENREEQQYIEDQLALHDGLKGVWIGLNSRRNTNVYMWPDNTAPSWTNWDIRQPPNVTDEKCVERVKSYRGTGQWNDNNCMEEVAFVCQKRAEGAVSYYDFTYNNNIYKIVWHQLPQAEGDPFCSRHLGHNASLWRVQDQAALESVGDELTKRVRGTGLQFWVAGDPTDNNTFTYWGKATVRQEPGRRCMMISRETVYRGYPVYYTWNTQPTPTSSANYVMTPRPCCEEKMVICEKRLGGSGDTFEHDGSIYRLVTTQSMAYTEAIQACGELLGEGGGLAVIESFPEQKALTAELKARHRGVAVQYWLGGRPGQPDQDPSLVRGPPSEGENCEVLSHENIAEVSWNKEAFDIVASSCNGQRRFICEVKVSSNDVTPTVPPPSAPPTIASNLSTVSPPSRVHLALIQAGCSGPCVGLAVAYPFTILVTVLLTVLVVCCCKRKPFCRCCKDSKGDHVLLMEIT